MSRVLNIIVEGVTEKEFVMNCMYHHFFKNGISNIRVITIETSPGHKGGDVRYARFKPNITKLLHGTEDMLVTSLIDFYKLRNDFPKFEEAQQIGNRSERVKFLEEACEEDINDNRFIPYIQLHEFEGLLFTKIEGFSDLSQYIPPNNYAQIGQIINSHPNPELINDGINTAPSKRLLNLIPNYSKPFHGVYVALENGFDIIMEKCPRFKNWIDTLIERMKEE